MADETTRDLRAYYEAEARLRLRGELSARRVTLIDGFVELLRTERRTSVVEFGAGPGADGERFTAAGRSYVGVDLAHGNGRLAAARGVHVVQGDVAALPLRTGAFDAGWSMSTLMHLPADRVPVAARQMAAVLRPGAPLLVGLWGGDGTDLIGEGRIEGQRRLFSLRTFERNAELLSAAGPIEWASTWDLAPDEWPYHVFRIRAAHPPMGAGV